MGGTQKTEHEPIILRWEDVDVDEADELHLHFTALEESGQLTDWIDVTDEGRRLWNMMFDDQVEEGSAIDSVLAAVAASGYELALRHIAKQLGVSLHAVKCALERSGKPDAERFVAKCRQISTDKDDD